MLKTRSNDSYLFLKRFSNLHCLKTTSKRWFIPENARSDGMFIEVAFFDDLLEVDAGERKEKSTPADMFGHEERGSIISA